MTFDEFTTLFTTIYSEHQKRSDFIDSLPSSISAAFFDNEYVTSYEDVNDILLQHIFANSLLYDINYFLYEFEPGFLVITDKREYAVRTLEDILVYFKERHFADDNSISI